MTLRHICLTLLASVTLATASRADMIGDTITATGTVGNLTPSSAVVGTGIEFTGVNGAVNFDFDADTLTITTGGALFAWQFLSNPYYIFAGFTDTIIGLSIVSNTGFTGTLVDNFSFTDHSITLDMGNVSVGDTRPGTLVFNIAFASSTETNNVPDSTSTLALLGSAMIGLTVLRRRFVRR